MSPLPIPGRSRSFEARWARCRTHDGIGGQKRYQWYIASSEGWRCRRGLMRERAGHRCQVCGATGGLEVHHNSYQRLGREEPQDLVVLCARCHQTYHRELDPRLAARGQSQPPPARRRRRWPWLALPLLAAGTAVGVAVALPDEWRTRLPEMPAIALPAREPAPIPAPVRTRPAAAATATVTTVPPRAGDATRTPLAADAACDPSYPTVCLPPAPPRLTCAATDERNFPVLPPDPHGLDRDRDGVACEPVAGG